MSESVIFKLPAEVRNMIYREVVTSPTDGTRVDIDHGIPEPGLLLTCKRIRQESLPLYYTINNFRLWDTKYNSTPYIYIRLKSIALGRQYRLALTARNMLARHPNWSNLIIWLQRYHQGSVNWKFVLRKADAYRSVAHAVVCTMFATVRLMKNRPWSVVAELMEAHHQVLLGLDPRWA